jgi:vacuolar-type H+-ATPase subunit F/Vma7
MKRFIVITHPEVADGFKLVGIETIAAQTIEDAERFMISILDMDGDFLIALDDGIFSKMDTALRSRIYAASHITLVTIPDGPIQVRGNNRKQRLYEMIRHATGIKFSFKGENTNND